MNHRPAPTDVVTRRLGALLRQWLLFGLMAVLLLPAARGQSLWIGWLPYWLVFAPALSLLLLERRQVIASLASVFAARRRRKPRVSGRQARRRPLRMPARRLSLAALLGGR